MNNNVKKSATGCAVQVKCRVTSSEFVVYLSAGNTRGKPSEIWCSHLLCGGSLNSQKSLRKIKMLWNMTPCSFGN